MKVELIRDDTDGLNSYPMKDMEEDSFAIILDGGHAGKLVYRGYAGEFIYVVGSNTSYGLGCAKTVRDLSDNEHIVIRGA